jgi:ferrochelatase
MSKSIGILMMNMGGPNSSEDVRPYLENIFRDKHILDMRMGFILRPFLAPRIAKKREPESIRRYDLIGGKTPLNEIASEQAEILTEILRDNGFEAKAAPAMRYWHPFASEALKAWEPDKPEVLVALSMYPQYCKATTYSCLEDVRGQVEKIQPGTELVTVDRWFDMPEYINFLARGVEEKLAEIPEEEHEKTAVIFSAHSIPVKLHNSGDPYKGEVEKSYELIRNSLNTSVKTALGWQSSFGPAQWLEPDSTEVVDSLAEEGYTTLVVVPLGFVAENIETLWDIEIDLREHAERAGITGFYRIACPNTDRTVLNALADRIITEIQEIE